MRLPEKSTRVCEAIPVHSLIRVQDQMPRRVHLQPQEAQGFCGWPTGDLSLQVIARSVAGAGIAIRRQVDGAAQVRTHQAVGQEPLGIADHHG